jgi:hypothetical protein
MGLYEFLLRAEKTSGPAIPPPKSSVSRTLGDPFAAYCEITTRELLVITEVPFGTKVKILKALLHLHLD